MGRNYRDELVGVFGMPVDGNPTVVIQEAAFKELGLPYRYLTIEVKPDDLGKAIEGVRAMNMKGINITMPYKTDVLKYLDHVAEDAMLMGAVNTIYVKDGMLFGENTDGKGFKTTLLNDGVDLRNKRIALLGAGGAARAISVELANAGASFIQVVNVSRGRGEELGALLNSKTPIQAEYHEWDETYRVPSDIDILVNGTSQGMFGESPNIDYDTILAKMIVCDVIINPPHTRFLREAEARGARTYDGLTMLVNQGALGFKLWTGLDAPVKVMKDAIERELCVTD